MDNFPSPSAGKPAGEGKEETILCNVCVEKNEKDKKQADMYCYICDTVYCDNHAGVRNLQQYLVHVDQVSTLETEISPSNNFLGGMNCEKTVETPMLRSSMDYGSSIGYRTTSIIVNYI